MDFTKALLLFSFVVNAFTVSASTAPDFQNEFTSILSNQNERDFSGQILIANGTTPAFSHNTLKENDAQFVIGSLSKQMTAALVLREVEKGTLALNQSIRTYLPDFPKAWGEDVNIANLLNHTSGLTKPDAELTDVPGSSFRYSNWGYDLLAQAAEQATGKSYSQLIQALFERCGLTQSFAPSAKQPSSHAENLFAGYFERELGKKELVTDAHPIDSVPSGGVISTVSDLVTWNQCLYQSKTVAENIGVLVTPTSIRQHRWGDIGYGAGLQVAETAAGTEYSHSGYVLGYISTMTYYPAHNVSLVILENVAWNPADMKRVFGLHDQIRAWLVERLSGQMLADAP